MNETHVCSAKANPESTYPISAVQAVASLKEYAQLACAEDGALFSVEYCPDEQGRNLLVRRCQNGEQRLTPEGFSVRSRVHEYGGLSWCLLDATRWVFINDQDQQLYLQSLDQPTPIKITDFPKSRFGEPVYHSRLNSLVLIEEIHSEGNVQNRLVSVHFDSGELKVLHSGHDFYMGFKLSDKGNQCVFLSWDHPYQPWLATRLHHAYIGSNGLVDTKVLAGEALNCSILQPSFDRSERIWAISDQGGWWNLHYFEQGELVNYWPVASDCAPAPWQFGNVNYLVTDEGIILTQIDQASMKLLLLRDGVVKQQLASSWSSFRSLCIFSGQLFCVGNSAISLSSLIAIELEKGSVMPLTSASQEDQIEPSRLAKPVHISIPIGGQDQKLHTLLYLPQRQQNVQTKRPPLILFFHGGPTACSYAVLQTRIQYWTQRGFAVADINYRGSAGYGRGYRLLLKSQWGVSDVEDANSVVDFLADRAYIDPRYVFVRGSSAGGFTALAALAASDRYCAGASLYGVTDPKVLAEQTHKFESYYLHWLIGDPECDAERYRDRAPIHTAVKISAPVIFFQGEKDAVVVPNQTRQMVHLLESQGVMVAAHYYADEAHGFRSAENLADALEKEHQFYRSVMDAED